MKYYNLGVFTGSVVFTAFWIMIFFVMVKPTIYEKGYQAGLNYTPPTMKMIDSLTIPEFTAKERRIIAQFMLIIKKASEAKE